MNHPAQGAHACPICALAGADVSATYRDPDILVSCLNCGEYKLSRTADSRLATESFSSLDRAVIAYRVRRQRPVEAIKSEDLEGLRIPAELPKYSDRVNNLIIHLAETRAPGDAVELDPRKLQATIGCEGPQQALWVMRQLRSMGLLEGDDREVEGYKRFSNASLSVQGWSRYEALLRDGIGSRHAFMAMKFNVAELDTLYKEALVPAVARTGFDLRRIDGPHKTAGLIDNRMRVEIRTSRFLVCDLTHANPGAYWEAGFAEGIGRPVFYICDQTAFRSKEATGRPHFDTNHQSIVVYDLKNPDGAIEELVAMIRETLRGEAIMEDAIA